MEIYHKSRLTIKLISENVLQNKIYFEECAHHWNLQRDCKKHGVLTPAAIPGDMKVTVDEVIKLLFRCKKLY